MTITATTSKRAAWNLSIANGGFAYEYCGDYYWVPATHAALAAADEAGMTLVDDVD